MDKDSKARRLFICFIMLLVTMFHGGFFSFEYIITTIIFLAAIISTKQIRISIWNTGLMAGIVLLHYLSSMLSGYNTGSAIVESTKSLLLFSVAIFGLQIKKEHFVEAVVVAAVSLALIGLFSICRIIEFQDYVYIHDGVKSLQSTMQYANSTAVMLVCGIFSIRALQKKYNKDFICSAVEMLLTVCLLFTHSRIAIIIYVALSVLEMLLLKKGVPVKQVAHLISAVLIYLCMEFLINEKLSFLALILCIIPILLISEKMCVIKNKYIRVNRLAAILIIVGMLMISVVVLCFTDKSTFIVRIIYYADGIKALFQNPYLGLSPGGWATYQYNYQSMQYYVNQIHNGVLQVGVDAGVLAMLLFVAVVLISVISLAKKWKNEKKDTDLYILLIFLVMIFHGILDFDFSYGNILIMLGVCIAYGFPKPRMYNLKIIHKGLTAFCIVFLVGIGACKGFLTMAQSEFNKGNYSKALSYYEVISKMHPFHAESDIMRGLCSAKLGNFKTAGELAALAYNEQPNNQNIILKAMEIAVNNNDFTQYLLYQEQLHVCAPLQQNTYANSMKFLEDFYKNNVINDELYIKEKNKVLARATEANERMSKYNKHLHLDVNINTNAFK